MANVLVEESALNDIATAIRSMNGSTNKYKPSEMAAAVSSISTGTDTSDATLDSGARMLSGYTAYAKGTKYTGNIAAKTASDLTASNNVVTVPAGYYASQATKTVGTAKAAATYSTSTADQTISSGQYLTGAQTIRAVTTSGIEAANIKDGTVVQVGDAGSAGRIKNVTGTFTDAGTVSSGQTAAAAAQIRSGYSAFVDGAEVKGTLASVSHPNPTASINSSTGLVTASHAQSTGYVTGGTTTGTLQLSTQAAQTITPGTTAKTIAAGKYLTGTQTIAGDANLKAANIASGVTIFGVMGTHAGGSVQISGTYTKIQSVDMLVESPDDLSVGRWYLAGASNSNYALFAGGAKYTATSSSSASYDVDAYNAALTRSKPQQNVIARSMLAGASIGSYAVFAGGINSTNDNGTAVATVVAYNTSLTQSSPTALPNAMYRHCGGNNDNYAIFAGGLIGQSNYKPYAYSYTKTSLTLSTMKELSATGKNLVCVKAGGYAVIACLTDGVVNAYGPSLTQFIPTSLSAAKVNVSGASVGDYALFGGGQISTTTGAARTAVVNAYDKYLTRTIPQGLNAALANERNAGVSVGSYAMFVPDSGYVETYDTALTHGITRSNSAMPNATVSFGDYGLITSGGRSYQAASPVTAYQYKAYIELKLDADGAFSDSGNISGGVTLS